MTLHAAAAVRVDATPCVSLFGFRPAATIWIDPAPRFGVLVAAAVWVNEATRIELVSGAAGRRAAAEWFENAASVAPGAREKVQKLGPESVQLGSARLRGSRSRGEGTQQEEGCESEN